MSVEREQTEKAADRIRDGLLVTIRELDRRREETLDVKGQFLRHRTQLEWVALGVLLAGVTVTAVVIAKKQYRQSHHRKYVLRGLLRAWRHPERIASRASEQPPSGEVARKVLTTVATSVAVQLAKRAVGQLMPSEE
jgi:hypothetical protein